MINIEELTKQLTRRKLDLKNLVSQIDNDLSHRKSPLPTDFDDQATELENEEVLQTLSTIEHHELKKIEAALARIANGSFGQCLSCDQKIEQKRLTALPTATQCMNCSVDE